MYRFDLPDSVRSSPGRLRVAPCPEELEESGPWEEDRKGEELLESDGGVLDELLERLLVREVRCVVDPRRSERSE